MATHIAADELGIELSRYRKERGLSLRDVGDEISVSAATLSRIENGNLPDSKRIIEKVADWLGVVIETGGGAKSRTGRDEVRRTMEVYLRAEKNLPEDVARAIVDAAESVMEYELRKRSGGAGADE